MSAQGMLFSAIHVLKGLVLASSKFGVPASANVPAD